MPDPMLYSPDPDPQQVLNKYVLNEQITLILKTALLALAPGNS